MVCGKTCEVYSRIVGYFRPVQRWNPGKAEEWKERVNYDKLDGEFLPPIEIKINDTKCKK